MYNGIGLQTPRGSGTNGYIQTNKFFVKPKTGKVAETTRGFEDDQGTAGVSKKPNRDILEHDRKRQIELKLLVLEDKLVDQGFTDEEVSEKLKEARRTLEAFSDSEENGGASAIVLAEKRVSDTQTHQIAARKEKQMETLRAALGLGPSEDSEQNKEGIYDPSINRADDQDANINHHDKPEHSFLDRESNWKKHTMEDQDIDKDDKKRASKDRHTVGTKKRFRNDRGGDHESDPESDVDKKYITSKKKKKKSRRHDSDDSDSSTDDGDFGKKKPKKVSGKSKKSHQKFSSEDSYSSTDDEEFRKKSHKKGSSQLKKSDSAHDNKASPKGQKVKKNQESRKQKDSTDESDSDRGVDGRGKLLWKHRNQHGERHVVDNDRSDSDREGLNRSIRGHHKKNIRKHMVDNESDPVKSRKHLNKDVGSRRHDTDDDMNSSSGSDEKVKRGRGRRHDTDDESDRRDEYFDRGDGTITAKGRVAIKKKSESTAYDSDNSDDSKGVGRNGYNKYERAKEHKFGDGPGLEKGFKSNGGARERGKGYGTDGLDLDKSVKKDENKLYNSGKEAVNEFNHGNPHTMKNKRKIDEADQNEQPELKSRSRKSTREEERDFKISSESNTRARHSRYDEKRDERYREDTKKDSESITRAGHGRYDEKRDERYREDTKKDSESITRAVHSRYEEKRDERYQEDTKKDSESITRAGHYEGDDRIKSVRSGSRHTDSKTEHGSRHYGQAKESHRHRTSQDMEGTGEEGKSHSRFDEHRGRKHERDEGHSKREVEEGEYQPSRRLQRSEKEDYETRESKRDREIDPRKRTKYDDSRSSRRDDY